MDEQMCDCESTKKLKDEIKKLKEQIKKLKEENESLKAFIQGSAK